LFGNRRKGASASERVLEGGQSGKKGGAPVLRLRGFSKLSCKEVN